MSYSQIEPAVLALQAGQPVEARALLKQVIQKDRRSEIGWLLLAAAAETEREQRSYLVRVLSVNPQNALALHRINALEATHHHGDPSMLSAVLEQYPNLAVQTEEKSTPPPQRATWIANPTVSPLLYLVGITAAELVTTFISPGAGLVLHAMLLATLISHTALTWGTPLHRLLLTLTLAPLIRLLSLTLPLTKVSTLYYWYFIVSVPLFAATLGIIQTLKFSPKGLGLSLHRPWLQFAIIFTGIAFGYAEYQIIRPIPLIKTLTWGNFWLPALILMVCTGFAEELIFRGLMQRTATDLMGRWGIVYTSAMFAALHIGYQSVMDVAFVFGVAMIFGWFKEHTESITGITVAHGLTNIFLFLLMPFLFP